MHFPLLGAYDSDADFQHPDRSLKEFYGMMAT